MRSEFFPDTLRVIGSVGLKLVISEKVKKILGNFKEAGIKITLTNEADHLANKSLLSQLPCFDEDNEFDIDMNEERQLDVVLSKSSITVTVPGPITNPWVANNFLDFA